VEARKKGTTGDIAKKRQKLHKTIQGKRKAYWKELTNEIKSYQDWYKLFKKMKTSTTAKTKPPDIRGMENTPEDQQIHHIIDSLLRPIGELPETRPQRESPTALAHHLLVGKKWKRHYNEWATHQDQIGSPESRSNVFGLTSRTP